MMPLIDFKNKELLFMADLQPKEVHEKRIAEQKARNLERAKKHYAGKIYNQPGMPHEKLELRLTTNKTEE